MKGKDLKNHLLEHELLGVTEDIERAFAHVGGGGGGGGGGSASDHATLSNLDYASAGHTGFQSALTEGIDYLNKTNLDLTYAPISVTQYTDADAISAIQGDASWNATDWDTAYGWGDHASGGYVKTDQTVGQTIGLTGSRLTKLWATDITVTNAIAGDITGNAATVTGLTLNSEALTLNTGALTLTPNADDSSVLTIGSGAVSVSGSNTGDQVIPDNEAGASNNFLTAYNNTTGAWTKARPTWANIDKTTSDIADLTTKSHTSLSDIGTNTHAQIDTFIGTTVPGTYAPLVSPSFTTPTLGVAQATSVDVGNGKVIYGSADDLTMEITQHASSPALNLYPAGGSLTSSRFGFRCVEGVNNHARFQGVTGTTAGLASSNTIGIVEFLITQADPSQLKGEINFWVNTGDNVSVRATLDDTGTFNVVGGYKDNGVAGIDTTFVDNDGNTITVSGGIITAKTAP